MINDGPYGFEGVGMDVSSAGLELDAPHPCLYAAIGLPLGVSFESLPVPKKGNNQVSL
jgi:hypothetical protein